MSFFSKAIYFVGVLIARARATFLEGFYSVHVKVRYIHDKTYQKGGTYKKWSDSKYSETVHRAALIGFVISFIAFSSLQSIFPDLFDVFKTNQVLAGSSHQDWTNRGHFNNGTTKSAPAPVISGSNDPDDANVTLQPGSLSWTADTTTTNAPTGREYHTAVWTGSKMIIWGGKFWNGDVEEYQNLNSGGLYDPSNNTWTATSGTGAPSARAYHAAVWTGSKMVIYGAGGNTGGIYDPSNNTWVATSTTNAPSITTNTVAVWMGTKMFVWGGDNSNVGGVWRPQGTENCNVAGGCWTLTPTTNNQGFTLNALQAPKAVWTGTNVLITGLYSGQQSLYIYDPVGNTFTIGNSISNEGRVNASVVWTGSRMVLWGGTLSGLARNTGWVYNPGTGQWSATSTTSAPTGRQDHTAVWNGTKMIIWGPVQTGGLWRPQGTESCADAGGCWESAPTSNAPTERAGHTSIWASSEMIVWGGWGSDTGKRLAYAYASSGSVSGMAVTPGSTARYTTATFAVTTALPANTSVTIAVKAADTSEGLTGATYYNLSGVAQITNTNEECTSLSASSTRVCYTGNVVGNAGGALAGAYAHVRATLASTNGLNTPTLDGVRLNWDTLEAPNNSYLSLAKSDDSTLKDSTGGQITNGMSGGYTNETSLKVTATNLTCIGCAISATNLRPEVQASTATDFSNPISATAPDNTNTATLTGLVAGSSYHIRVRAVDAQSRVSGWTSYGGDELTADVRVEQTVPSGTIAIGSSEYTTSISVNLALSASDSGGSNLSNMILSNDGVFDTEQWEGYATTKAWTLSEGDELKTVYVKFRDNAGNESTTQNDTITLDREPPSAPANVTAYNDNTKQTSYNQTSWYSDSSVYIEWTAGEAGATYKYCTDTAGTCTPTASLGTTNSYSWDLSGALDSVKHFRVLTVDTATNESSVTDLTYKMDKTVPSAPTGQSATTDQLESITFSWNVTDTGSPVENYVVERILYSEFPGGNDWTGVNSLTAFTETTNSHTDTYPDIQKSVRYLYRVKVKDVANQQYSPFSATAEGMTNDTQDPSPGPTAVSANACDGVNYCTEPGNKGFEIQLSWTGSQDSGSGVAGYRIYRTTNPANGYIQIGSTVGIGATTFNDNDAAHEGSPELRLNDGGNDFYYYYKVTAYDNSGNETGVVPVPGENNSAYTETPDVTPPSIPANVSAAAGGIDASGNAQKVRVTWGPSTDSRAAGRVPTGTGSGVASYKVYRSDSLNGTYALQATVTGSTNYTQEGLSDYTWYYYKVASVDVAGNPSDPSTRLSTPGAPVRTSSSEAPTVPANVSITSEKGDPNPSASTVGEKITVSFNGSYSRNFMVDTYEVYRSTSYGSSQTDEEWIAGAALVETVTVNVQDDRSTTRNFIDYCEEGDESCAQTALNDATKYYYRIRARHTNPDAQWSPLSGVDENTPGSGWDITPDSTSPALPSEVKVKDIHDDGLNYKRNIITWQRIATPTRGGNNDFYEYRIYRSTDGTTWQQVCDGGAGTTIMRSACDVPAGQYPNPLYKNDKEVGLATNYYMDLIPSASANQYYYYYVTAVDDAKTEYKYETNGTPFINAYSNESAPVRTAGNLIVSVSLNPAIARPTITNQDNGMKAKVYDVGVSSATIEWKADQPTDSVVEFRPASGGEWITIGDRTLVAAGQPHVVKLFGLEPKTTYNYKIISRNSLGNEDVVGDVQGELSSLPTVTTNEFTITAGEVITTTSTAEINWTTNLNASSAFVEYQLQRRPGDEPHSGTSGVAVEDLAESPKNHKVIIKGLRSSRPYTYKIKSITSDGFIAETGFLNFNSKSYDSAQFTLTPSSSNVAERNITATTAMIAWQTATPTTSWVDYSIKSGVYDMSSGNNDLNTSHAVQLEGLVPGTTYYYRVRVKDANEVEYTSQEYSFKAVLKPKISNMTIKDVTPYAVTISWVTNVDTETLLNWGKSAAYGEKRGIPGMTKNHEITIENLEDNTEYHFQILAKDEMSNEVADEDKVVRTPLDTEGPKIKNVKTEVLPVNDADNTSQVIISWETNKPATSLIEYDEGAIGSTYSKSSIEDKTLSPTHTVIIKGLEPGTTYRYRIVTADKRGNVTNSNDYTFVTPSKEKSILQLIIKSLEETFSWVRNIGSFFRGLGKKAN